MRRLVRLIPIVGFFLLIIPLPAQLSDFGDRAVELRGLGADELAKPDIPEDAIVDAPAGTPGSVVPRPLTLVCRYYSVIPWLRSHVRSVSSSVPGFLVDHVEIDTGNDNAEAQLVTDINHPAYGLCRLTVKIIVPWDQWQAGAFHRFYVRLHSRAPYIASWEHWWYYFQSPRYAFQVQLNSAQEVPPNNSPATGSGVLFLDPAYKTLGYDISYSGLSADFTAAHIHGPAGPGTNAGVIFPLTNIPSGTRAGRLFGSTPPLSATQIGYLNNGLLYANIHSTAFPGGEIRGQIRPAAQAVYRPWRPAWIPLLRWGRVGPTWTLAVTHPCSYPWEPWYKPRPVSIYGLQYSFTWIGDVRQPAQVPYIAGLSLDGLASNNWLFYPKPPLKCWPYMPSATRIYWFSQTPFSISRYLPPTVQFATWVNPDLNDPPVVQAFPDGPQRDLAGTVAISTVRALVSQQADLTGDGFVTLQDLSAFRLEQGTASQDTADTDGP